MQTPKKKWAIERPDQQIIQELTKDSLITPIQAKILATRGIQSVEEATAFLQMDEKIVVNAFQLPMMEKAVNRIFEAIELEEPIALYGDYDADGVTSLTVLKKTFEQLGVEVEIVIPNRFTHGYGPNKELFQELADKGCKLIITVDNGVSGVEEVAFVQSLGVDVIITDHHEAGASWPNAFAIIHPAHPDSQYPHTYLAGVGVAYKLATALIGEELPELLQFVAIGTIADLVPLLEENRYFVQEGLKQIRTTTNLGLRALFECSGTAIEETTEETIGFSVGPRINAIGRLGPAYPAVDLLTTEDAAIATALAEQLDQANKERQGIVQQIMKEVEEKIEQQCGQELPPIFVIEGQEWNAGVVGIVASRIVERFYRPTIILCTDEQGNAKGSGRSIEGFHLYDELTLCSEWLTHYGGHPMAAGLSMKAEDIPVFRERLTQRASTLTEEQLTPVVKIDVPITVSEITVEAIDQLASLRPYGIGFPKPIYALEQVQAEGARQIGAGKNHLKLTLMDQEAEVDAIGFQMGERLYDLSSGVELQVAGDIQINEWNGLKKPQFIVRDFQATSWQVFDFRGITDPKRWVGHIPAQATVAYFHEETKKNLQVFLPVQSFLPANQIEQVESIVLADLPPNKESVEKLVKKANPDRLYLHWQTPPTQRVTQLPTREDFARYYRFLQKRPEGFAIEKHGEAFAQHTGWEIGTIYFMTTVFSQLQFVKLEEGLVKSLPMKEKRALTEAPIYQQREQQRLIEEQLLLTPFATIKAWLEATRTSNVVQEEMNQ